MNASGKICPNCQDPKCSDGGNNGIYCGHTAPLASDDDIRAQERLNEIALERQERSKFLNALSTLRKTIDIAEKKEKEEAAKAAKLQEQYDLRFKSNQPSLEFIKAFETLFSW